MLKIREELKTVEDVREEVYAEFRHAVNSDKPVMKQFKEQVVEHITNNEWAGLQELYNRTGEAALQNGISRLVTDITNSTFEAVFQELNWELLDKAEMLLLDVELLEEEPEFLVQLKNAIFIANEMIETIYYTRRSSYVAGLSFAEAINKQLDENVEFWYLRIKQQVEELTA